MTSSRSRLRPYSASLLATGLALLSLAGCGDEGGETAVAATATATIEVKVAPGPSSSTAPAPPTSSVKVNAALPEEEAYPTTLAEQREAMLRRMKALMRVDDEELAELRAIFQKSPVLSQGNPDITEYAMTRAECRKRRDEAGVFEEEDAACGAPFMSPIWNPKAGETKANARVCIDRYEFPGIPCEHPVTWVQAREAALMCKAIGKRICDAHEWEGACAGAVLEPDTEYAWKLPRKESKFHHNQDREIVWSYGGAKDFSKCAMDSHKSKKCAQSGWKLCGSNTYPAGSFPECKSPFGVFDLHGNAAEHMNLPLKPAQLASRGGSGETEMKGSWFIFKKYEAHDDDCRWRAPDWHGTKLMSHDSHLNYHLGFRCCRDL